ncbi:RNA-directed DNA polymerase, eukaryota [Tanacetum coccineum]
MSSFRSKENDVAKISITIYVTNFPEATTAKELFHACNVYGHVVDSFIPTKRAKNDHHKLHANISRFHRNNTNGTNGVNKAANGSKNTTNPSSKTFVPPTGTRVNKGGNSYAKIVTSVWAKEADGVESSPVTVLDDECLVSKDISNSLFGRVKEFASLVNLKMTLTNEGFADVTIQYMGEFWVMIKFVSQEAIQKFRDNVSIGSWFSILKDATLDFHTDKRIAWVETEGIPFKLWTDNSFKRIAARWGELLSVDDQEDSCFHSKRLCVHTRYTRSISEDFKIIHRGKVHWIRAKETPGWVPDFEEENEEEDIGDANSNEDADRKGPNFYGDEDDMKEDSVKFNRDEEDSNDTESSLSHPLGFSHVEGHEHNQGQDGNNIYSEGDAWTSNGVKMEGWHEKHGLDIIEAQGVEEVVCVVELILLPNISGLRKKAKRSGLRIYVIRIRWDGETVVTGDFNEVRHKSERFGTMFYAHEAKVFNTFIADSGLVEVSLGGSKFTWCHKSGSKMSKLDRFLVSENLLNTSPNINAITLARYLSDHRPILLREISYDYGPIPFKVFHYWFDMNGFNNLVEVAWKEYPGADRQKIEGDVTNDEIKKAVWDCGTDKAPGPDGFTFGFFRRYWDLIMVDVTNAVRLVCVIKGIVNEVQSAFIADRQILDGPFILNEVIQWCKLKKKHALIFKVDFEKAYDSVRIIHCEGLVHNQGVWNLEKGLFQGINIGEGLVNISHMFYADDAVFVGQWCDRNISTLVHVLECFHKVSGLRINMCKSKIMGVHVYEKLVRCAAKQLGCLTLSVPFSYLVFIVGRCICCPLVAG